MQPTIIHEDESLIVINKPAGLVVHSDQRTSEPTLAEWLLTRSPALATVGGMHTLDNARYEPRMGILHRLDRETSGILLVAKNDEVFYFVQRQFSDHSIQKTYCAFVEGVFESKSGIVELPIGRSRSDFRRFATGVDARGTLRKATTTFNIIATNGKYSFVELIPKTGRTHQLRVHMHAIGHPIVSDSRYGSSYALGFDRVALHAQKIEFTHPNGVRMAFEAPFPADFEQAKSEIV